MKLPEKKIHELILDIKRVQCKCLTPETMFVYHALGKALDTIGWSFAEKLMEKKIKRRPS